MLKDDLFQNSAEALISRLRLFQWGPQIGALINTPLLIVARCNLQATKSIAMLKAHLFQKLPSGSLSRKVTRDCVCPRVNVTRGTMRIALALGDQPPIVLDVSVVHEALDFSLHGLS